MKSFSSVLFLWLSREAETEAFSLDFKTQFYGVNKLASDLGRRSFLTSQKWPRFLWPGLVTGCVGVSSRNKPHSSPSYRITLGFVSHGSPGEGHSQGDAASSSCHTTTDSFPCRKAVKLTWNKPSLAIPIC